jgi:hypothetical protein
LANSSRSSGASGVQDYPPDELEGIAEVNESTEAPSDFAASKSTQARKGVGEIPGIDLSADRRGSMHLNGGAHEKKAQEEVACEMV